jgi:hypothetical protein
MLYNKNWDVKTKKDLFTIEALIEWLETKDPNASYDYCKSNECLGFQYLVCAGVPVDKADVGFGGRLDDFIPGLHEISIARYDDSDNRWSYGSALERARHGLLKSK